MRRRFIAIAFIFVALTGLFAIPGYMPSTQAQTITNLHYDFLVSQNGWTRQVPATVEGRWVLGTGWLAENSGVCGATTCLIIQRNYPTATNIINIRIVY